MVQAYVQVSENAVSAFSSQGLLKVALPQNEEQAKEEIPRSGARKATPSYLPPTGRKET